LFSGKDRAFFFFNYEELPSAESTLRTRTIMSPSAQSGLYRFFNATNIGSTGTLLRLIQLAQRPQPARLLRFYVPRMFTQEPRQQG
jgi:hypothetical protein